MLADRAVAVDSSLVPQPACTLGEWIADASLQQQHQMRNFWQSVAIGAGLEFDAVWRVPATRLCEQEVFVTELCGGCPRSNAVLLGVSRFFIKGSLALVATSGSVPIIDMAVLTWCA